MKTNKEKVVEYLERQIDKCDELTSMEREKWAFIQCLKFVRQQPEPEGELMIMCDRCGYYCDAKLEECPTCSPPQQPSEGEIPKCPHENTFVCMRHCNTDSCGFHPNYQ